MNMSVDLGWMQIRYCDDCEIALWAIVSTTAFKGKTDNITRKESRRTCQLR